LTAVRQKIHSARCSVLPGHLCNERRGETGGSIFGGEAQIDLAASPDEIGEPIHGAAENRHRASFRGITIAVGFESEGAGSAPSDQARTWRGPLCCQ